MTPLGHRKYMLFSVSVDHDNKKLNRNVYNALKRSLL